jgi:Ca-activated chloride channel family protein
MDWRNSAAIAALAGLVCAALGGCAAAGEPLEWEVDELDHVERRSPDPEPDEPGDRCVDAPRAGAEPVDADVEPTQGRLLSRRADGTWVGLPLLRTSFDAVVVGTVAETLVTQRFVNPLDEPAELVYVFPLPTEAAVDDYWFEIGDRTIQGALVELGRARQTYEDARDDGLSAALLEQSRPDVFVQRLANVPPRGEVGVSIHLVQALRQDAGRFELVFPTVVGPRYRSELEPPSLGAEGPRRCGALDVTVAIDAGVPVDDLRSRAHAVRSRMAGDEILVELEPRPDRLDRDFVLSWSVRREAAQAALQLQQEDERGGYFTLSVYPPVPEHAQVPGREIVFVVDTSGSMEGAPLETAKAAMRRFLRGLGPDDAFQVVRFSSDASSLGAALVPATPERIAEGLAYVDALVGGGGTEMTAGIRTAFGLPGSPDRMRMVVFLTDGYIGNESEILALVRAEIDDARLFSLGVGSSVHRFLLDGLARVGRGAVAYVDVGAAPDPAVDRFYEQIGSPALTDVEIDWGALAVFDVAPEPLPDLFVGRPLVVFGRWAGAFPTRVTVRGRAGDRAVEIQATVRPAARHGRGDGLGSLWARRHIEGLELSLLAEPSPRRIARVEREVLRLALEHRILTEQTAFVAVDVEGETARVTQGNTIEQALDGPRGIAWQTRTFGGPLDGEGGTGEDLGSGAGGGSGSGYGHGSGAGFGGRGGRVPTVRAARAQVKGALDAAIIRRIVRAHLNEIRGCYNLALVDAPRLRGRLELTFVIAADGGVQSASAELEGGDAPALSRCVTHAVRRWRFPVGPDHGTSVVHYPFALEVAAAIAPDLALR